MEISDPYSIKNKLPGSIKRMKISRACDECRKRKVKCDGVHPCGRCKKSSIELQRVEKALRSIHEPARRLYEENDKKQRLDYPPRATEVVSYSAPYTSDMTLSQIDRFTVNEIGQALYSDIASISDSPISSHSIFHPPMITNTQYTSETPIADHLSSQHMIIEVQPLIDTYFDYVHKYVPMIHKPSFLKQMHSSTNPPSRFLLYSMAAVAKRWSPEHIQSHRTKKDPVGYTYHQKALDLIDDFMDVPRLSTIQGLVLILKYQETYQRKGYLHRSQFYLQLAVRMAFDLGLSEVPNGMDSYELESKRRTFWVLFTYDLLMNIEQGQRSNFELQKCVTGFPMVTGEEGPALEELIINQNILIQLIRTLSSVYAMSRLTLARQRLKDTMKTKETVIEEQARLFSLHTHLENFLYEVPPTLIYPPTQDTESYPADKQQIGDPFIGFLHMTYHFSTILLHRQYISDPLPKTEFNFVAYHHRRLCATSASNITFIVETLQDMYPDYTFNYPIRGVQLAIHCLTSAATIHKYEILNGDNECIRHSAKEQYMLTHTLLRNLSHLSPNPDFASQFDKELNTEITPSPTSNIHYVNKVPTARVRKRSNTFSSPGPVDQSNLYLQSNPILTDLQYNSMILQQHPQYSYPVQQWSLPHDVRDSQYRRQSRTMQPPTQLQDIHDNQYRIPSQPQDTQDNPYRIPSQPLNTQDNQYRLPSQPMHTSQPQLMNWSSPYYTPTDLSIVPSHPPVQTNNKIRRHTVSYPSHYYPNDTMHTNLVETKSIDKQPVLNYQHDLSNLDVIIGDTSTFMLDPSLHHYDPSNGISQLFLVDDQQLTWESEGCIQRGEGHAMK
ncbi:fungal-specific transcription factor domain-containing protein [Pilobolus umbonatus]|nr:fungal-specific transcription factor domain-containing protein [Pilobolus umbonatus]